MKTKIIKIFFIALLMAMALSIRFKYQTMTSLKKIGLEYAPCIEDVCLSLNGNWVVMYNDKSLLGNLISMKASPDKKALYLFKKEKNVPEITSARIFKYDPMTSKLNSEKVVSIKKYNWGEVKILSSDIVSEPDDKIRLVNEEYGLFITVDNMRFLDDIKEFKVIGN